MLVMKGIFSREWRFVLGLLTPIVAVIAAWFALQADVRIISNDIVTIKGNHLLHIEAALTAISAKLDNLVIQETETRTKLDDHLNR